MASPIAALSLLLQLLGVSGGLGFLSGHGSTGSVLAILLVGAALAGLGSGVAAMLRAVGDAARVGVSGPARPARPGRSDVSTPAVQHRPDAPGRRLPRAPGASIPAV